MVHSILPAWLQPLEVSGVVFTKNSQSNSSYPTFEPLQKSLNIIVSLLKLKDYFVELKVAILEQFKLLNLNKKIWESYALMMK